MHAWLLALLVFITIATAIPIGSNSCGNCRFDVLEESINVFVNRSRFAKAQGIISENRLKRIENFAELAKFEAEKRNVTKLAETIDLMTQEMRFEPKDRSFLDDAISLKDAYNNGGFERAVMKGGEILLEKAKEYFEFDSKPTQKIMPKIE